MSEETFFLYDDKETTETRFVSFMGRNTRFDLAIVKTTRHYGKSLVLNMLGSHYAIIGQDDLEEEIIEEEEVIEEEKQPAKKQTSRRKAGTVDQEGEEMEEVEP